MTGSDEFDVRKWVSVVEEIRHEGGPDEGRVVMKAAAIAIIANPVAGSYHPDLDALVRPSAALGEQLGRRAFALLEGRPVEGYGKAALVGVDGEQEHAAAVLTTVFGDGLRTGIGGGRAWLPSAKKVGGTGEPVDIPVAFKDNLYVRSHYDTVTVRVADAPRPREILVGVAVTSGGRIHHRVGGLTIDEAMIAAARDTGS